MWGGTAHCGCCNTRSSAAPPRRAATPRSWRWCCPPCCGRFQRPPPVSCTPPGLLSLLLPEHLRRAKRETGDEMGSAAVTNPPQPPLLQVKDPTRLLRAQEHTNVLSLSLTPPALSLYRAVWRKPQDSDASHCSPVRSANEHCWDLRQSSAQKSRLPLLLSQGEAPSSHSRPRPSFLCLHMFRCTITSTPTFVSQTHIWTTHRCFPTITRCKTPSSPRLRRSRDRATGFWSG